MAKKTWIKPKIEWVEFQAEEYVNACAPLGTNAWGIPTIEENKHCLASDCTEYTRFAFFINSGADMTASAFNDDYIVHAHTPDMADVANIAYEGGWLFRESDVKLIREHAQSNPNALVWDSVSSDDRGDGNITFFGKWASWVTELLSGKGFNGFGGYGYLNSEWKDTIDIISGYRSSSGPVTGFRGGSHS